MMNSRVRALPQALSRLGRVAALCVLPGLALGCTKPQDRTQPGIDCRPMEAGSPYEFFPIVTAFWFSYGDDAPSALRSGDVTEGGTLPNPPAPDDFTGLPAELMTEEPCNAWLMLEDEAVALGGATIQNNLRFRASGHTQWGSGFGTALSQRGHGTPEGQLNAFIPGPRDGSEWQGIAFWAKSARQKDRTITIEIQTAQTAKPADGSSDFLTDNLCMRTCLATKYDLPLPEQLIEEHPCDCLQPAEASGALNARVNPDGTVTLSGSEPQPGDCGNSFRQEVTVSTRWKLYFLPFADFWQEARPNRVSGGLDASAIYQLGLRVDIEKDVDMLTSQWVFYRHEDFQPKVREDRAADCTAPEWDISYPENPLAGGEGGAPDTSTAETECQSECNIEL